MVELGAYEAGSNPELDIALGRQPHLLNWLRQSAGGIDRMQALDELTQILSMASSGAKGQT